MQGIHSSMTTKNTSLLHKSNKQLVRSPLFYVGDKYKLISQLLGIFPTNIKRFVEPFTGGGSVAMNVDADEYYLNDIDENIVNIHKLLERYATNEKEFFKVVSSMIESYGLSRSYSSDIVPPILRAQWKKTYYARFNESSYRRLRDDYNSDIEKDAFKLYLLLIYGFNRMIRFNGQGNFNLPVGNVDFNKNVVQSLEAYFSWARKKKVVWNNLDYLEFLKAFKFKKGDFLYLDPPYLITFSEYNKIWDEKNEFEILELLDKLNKLGVKFAISNVTHYKGRINSIFLEWSRKYSSNEIKSNYISYHDNSIKNFKEVVVTNY
ncbi:MAG: adenine methylase [Candidatus Saccharibacteria bacterium]|nr:adenine methylase [Candidatus Saccharibacteria bacterium]